MSLILEALRKSEAERRRGEVPGLHAERAPVALPARDAPPLWLWLALGLAMIAVVAMAVGLVRGRWAPRTVVPLTGPAGASPSTGAAADRPRMDPARTVPAEPMTTRRDVATAAPAEPARGATPDPSQSGTAATAAGQEPSTPVDARPTAPRSLPARTPSGERATATVATPESATQAPAPKPAIAVPTRTPALAAVDLASDAPATDAAIATATSADPAKPLRLADLTAAERRELPALKMSMHLWSPTQRFAIIDGARVGEGDRLGEAVVDEITASGVVLAWRGRRVQIPNR